MFHSSAFTMAYNITPDEDEPMHPAGLDMTRGSLQGILDGDEVNVSTALPAVPLDATNPFINPNQTLADIIPGQNLGPLSSLKITDADLIIYKARHAHKCLYTVLPKYSKIQVLPGITSCRLVKDNKQAIELNSLLLNNMPEDGYE